MKNNKSIWAAAAVVIILAAAHSASAQSFSIKWSKIAGGGGMSTNANFTLRGTIAQHDASGPVTNAHYSVRGGFWALPQVIQTVGAPALTIVPGGPGQAIISWSPATPGFVLQETASLNSPTWTNSASGSANPVTVSTLAPANFFRLKKP